METVRPTEKVRSIKNKVKTAMVAGIVLIAAACETSDSTTGANTDKVNLNPPEGFSGNPADYKYRIALDASDRGFWVNVYTNEVPLVEGNTDDFLLKAKNVYCPEDQSHREDFCGPEFSSTLITNPDNIRVFDNVPDTE